MQQRVRVVLVLSSAEPEPLMRTTDLPRARVASSKRMNVCVRPAPRSTTLEQLRCSAAGELAIGNVTRKVPAGSDTAPPPEVAQAVVMAA